MKNADREHKMQCSFIRAARLYLRNTGFIIYANPNQGQSGGKKATFWGAYFKKEGKLAGVPDTFLAWPRLGFHGLYIEFKLNKNEITGSKKTYLEPPQREAIEALRVAGYCVAVCRDSGDAYDLMLRYTLGADKDAVMREHNWK